MQQVKVKKLASEAVTGKMRRVKAKQLHSFAIMQPEGRNGFNSTGRMRRVKVKKIAGVNNSFWTFEQ